MRQLYDVSDHRDLVDACEELNGKVKRVSAQGGGEKDVCEFQTHDPEYEEEWVKNPDQTWWINDTGSMSGVLLERVPDSYSSGDTIESTGDAMVLTDPNDSEIEINHLGDFETVLKGDKGTAYLNVDNLENW